MAPKAEKRKIESIDLTNSDDDVTHSPSAHKRRAPEVRLLPPPSTAVPRSSQNNVVHGSSWRTPLYTPREEWGAEDDEFLATQANDDSFSQNYVLYGVIDTKVVGIRFYQGVATRGERVLIRREPANPVSLCCTLLKRMTKHT